MGDPDARSSLPIAPEGIPFLLGAAALAAAVTGLLSGWGGLPIVVPLTIGAGAIGFMAYFFRDPAPRDDAPPDLVLAPAQGRVSDIADVEHPYMGGRCRRIGIFLSIFDVHIQRAPLAGLVEDRSYRSGRFLAAFAPEASADNERCELCLQTEAGPVVLRQIAGLVARRIVTDPKVGDRVARGGRIGLIRFGSRVELLVPLDWAVLCSVGDRVRVGRTAVARRTASKSEAQE